MSVFDPYVLEVWYVVKVELGLKGFSTLRKSIVFPGRIRANLVFARRYSTSDALKVGSL